MQARKMKLYQKVSNDRINKIELFSAQEDHILQQNKQTNKQGIKSIAEQNKTKTKQDKNHYLLA